MSCGCKSNSSVRKQVTQITKKNESTHSEMKTNEKTIRKQIIVKRPY